MSLKVCSCCKVKLTTKNVQILGRQDFGGMEILYFNCKSCGSTMVLKAKPKKGEAA